jgi:hypothetical protein
MVIRTTSRTVVLTRPFTLSGLAEPQPPGTYVVETDEEVLDTISAPAYRRVSTLIRLPGRPGSSVLEQVIDVDPEELAAVLAKD